MPLSPLDEGLEWLPEKDFTEPVLTRTAAGSAVSVGCVLVPAGGMAYVGADRPGPFVPGLEGGAGQPGDLFFGMTSGGAEVLHPPPGEEETVAARHCLDQVSAALEPAGLVASDGRGVS